MTRNAFIFLATFAVGALIALVARASLFNPHAGHENAPASQGGDYVGMVSNPLSPASNPAHSGGDATPKASPPRAEPAHAPGHGNQPAPAKSTTDTAVNTLCAICGMDVDPNLPTAEYQGKTIGFGCKMCRPKFEADPDRYGPSYLRNELIKK